MSDDQDVGQFIEVQRRIAMTLEAARRALIRLAAMTDQFNAHIRDLRAGEQQP